MNNTISADYSFFCLLVHLPLIKWGHTLSFSLLQMKSVTCCCFTGNSRKKRRTFFKIIDAAVVVAYTPLLINDRFCSRTSSLRCRQCYCLFSACLSLSPFSFWSQQPRPYMNNKKIACRKKKEVKEMPGARSCTLKEKTDRQTRFIYLSSQSFDNTFMSIYFGRLMRSRRIKS